MQTIRNWDELQEERYAAGIEYRPRKKHHYRIRHGSILHILKLLTGFLLFMAITGNLIEFIARL